MSYLRQMSWFTVGNVGTLFFQWLIIMIIPNITGFEEAGVFAVAISVASITNQIATFNLYQHQVAHRYEKYSERDYAVVRWITIAISYCSIIPIVLLFGYGMEHILIIVAYTTYRNLINYAYLHIASLQIKGRLDYVGICMMVEGVASFAVFISSYVIAGDLFISTALMAMIGGGGFLLMMAYGYRRELGHPYAVGMSSSENTRDLLKIGIPLLISTLCPIIITALPKLLLQEYHGDEITGIFSTLSAPTIVVPTVITSMFAPLIIMFADMSKNNDMMNLRKHYLKISFFILIIGIVCCIASMFFADAIFTTIYGNEISQYTDYFVTLILSIFFYSIGMCGITVLITKDQGKQACIGAMISLAISIAIFIMWIPDGGIDAAVDGLLLSYGVFGLIISILVLSVPLRSND